MPIKSEISNNERKVLFRRLVLRFSLVPLFLGLLILLPAGTFDYWQAYALSASLLIPMTGVLAYFIRNDPMLLERRMKTKEKEKKQKLIQIIFSLLFAAAFVVSGFDRRFGWSDIPLAAVLAADAAVIIGYTMVFFVFRQNSYASRIVQVEEGQQIISTGLYGIIRHPMYDAVIIMWVPIPVALGSYWGLLPMSAIPAALVLRIFNEESVLMRDLPGYGEYCSKVKWRLIPCIW